MTEDNKTKLTVNINEGKKEYFENSCAAMVDFSVTVTRKYRNPDGSVGFDVVGTERDSYVAQLESDSPGDAVNETLKNVKECRNNWSVMGVVKDDEESKTEFKENIENLSPLATEPSDEKEQDE